jgi:hypothetical protein
MLDILISLVANAVRKFRQDRRTGRYLLSKAKMCLPKYPAMSAAGEHEHSRRSTVVLELTGATNSMSECGNDPDYLTEDWRMR